MAISRKQWLQTAGGLLGICTLVAYFAWRSPPAFWSEALHITPGWVIAGTASYLTFTVFATMRWSLLLGNRPADVKWTELWLVTILAKGLGAVTPMNAGEFLKAEISHRINSESRGKQFAIVTVERVLDVLMMLIFAAFGIAFQNSLRALFNEQLSSIILFGSVGILLAAVMGWILFRSSSRVKSLVYHSRDVVYAVLKQPSVLLLTIVQWAFIAFLWILLARAFHVQLGFTDSLLIISVVVFIQVGSLLPGGVGVADIGGTEIAHRLGYTINESLLIMLAVRLNTLISLVTGGIAFFLRSRKQ